MSDSATRASRLVERRSTHRVSGGLDWAASSENPRRPNDAGKRTRARSTNRVALRGRLYRRDILVLPHVAHSPLPVIIPIRGLARLFGRLYCDICTARRDCLVVCRISRNSPLFEGQHILEQPTLVEEGFQPRATERETSAGPVDNLLQESVSR